jgi:alpha-1,2-rhamnosyltransferase
MYNELNDAELNVCYDNASAVLFSSYVEGFGLPIVEAKQRGVPVFASDIPVFREIGEDRVYFFDLDDPSSLAALIKEEVHTEHVASNWLSWREATQMFIDALRD